MIVVTVAYASCDRKRASAGSRRPGLPRVIVWLVYALHSPDALARIT